MELRSLYTLIFKLNPGSCVYIGLKLKFISEVVDVSFSPQSGIKREELYAV